jgi:hypothetical protein
LQPIRSEKAGGLILGMDASSAMFIYAVRVVVLRLFI